ncbi:MAG TPA: DUF2262 domain-containing protein [Planctomycetaceae bacterium]|jgi:hypothetical protein|nr:DUF2262 domain-containing protein [Planctomycetaceae bacterium]
MYHEILGQIECYCPGHGEAVIDYESRKIKVLIASDGEPFELTVELAAEVVRKLHDVDQAARRIIVAQLLDTYNSGWNEHDELQEDGSLKTVRNPQLSADEFVQKFSLTSVTAMESREVDLFYDDDSNLFWGHCVIVSSRAGTDFSDGEAKLFG